MDLSEEAPDRRPPLGLPVGSVRALLTLFVVAVVTISVANGREFDVMWIETLLIALAHYFTSRRFIDLPPQVLKRIKDEGLVVDERHPLFLPRHSIRLLIFASFVGLGVYLQREGRLWEPRSVSLLGMVAAYVLGSVLRGIGGWIGRRTNRPPSSAWGDAKAIIVLLAVVAVGVPELLNASASLPPEAHKVALAMMLFYFGSR